MKTPSSFPITPDQQQDFVAFIAKKVAFDQMALEKAATKELRDPVISHLQQAAFLYQMLSTRPDRMSKVVVREMAEYLMQSITVYAASIRICQSMGIHSREIQTEITKARKLYQVINEFLIELIED